MGVIKGMRGDVEWSILLFNAEKDGLLAPGYPGKNSRQGESLVVFKGAFENKLDMGFT